MIRLPPAPIKTILLNADKTRFSPTWERWFRDLEKIVADINNNIENNNGSVIGNVDYIYIGKKWRLYISGEDLVFEYRATEADTWAEKGRFIPSED